MVFQFGVSEVYTVAVIDSICTYRSLLFKVTNLCVFCDLEKSAKFKDRKTYAVCASVQRYIPCARSERANASWYVQRVHKKTALRNFPVHVLHYAVFLRAAHTTH